MNEAVKRELEDFGFSDSEARQFWRGLNQAQKLTIENLINLMEASK